MNKKLLEKIKVKEEVLNKCLNDLCDLEYIFEQNTKPVFKEALTNMINRYRKNVESLLKTLFANGGL